MVSSLAFSMRLLQTAIDLCQQELDAGNFCLLVKKFNYITVWKEKQLEQPVKKECIRDRANFATAAITSQVSHHR